MMIGTPWTPSAEVSVEYDAIADVLRVVAVTVSCGDETNLHTPAKSDRMLAPHQSASPGIEAQTGLD